jgi:hypothetical protein
MREGNMQGLQNSRNRVAQSPRRRSRAAVSRRNAAWLRKCELLRQVWIALAWISPSESNP